MQGICIQWFIDKYGNNSKIMDTFKMYSKITRKTFGYRQRFGYIPQKYFNLNPKTMQVHRDKLVEIGILEWKKTKQMTYYKILEPYNEISNFIFVGKKDNEEKEITNELESNKYL